jgi:fructokinase
MIAVVGEALFDAHMDGDACRLFPGGGPFNTAVALARLGVPVCYVGAISRDRLGRKLLRTLVSAGVDTDVTARVDPPTPLAIVDPAEIEPSYSFYLAGTAHETLHEHLVDLPDEVATLHVGTLALATDPPGDAVATFAERQARDCVLMIDPNIRPALVGDRRVYRRRLDRLVAVADIVKLSASDLEWLDPDDLTGAEVVGRLLDLGAGCVLVTYGPDGAQAWTGAGASAKVAAPEVTVADTIGAGDAFGAGWLAWLWRHDRLSKRGLSRIGSTELEAALRYAAAAGAAQCMRPSAWAPTAADVEEVLRGSGHPSHAAIDPCAGSSLC